MKNDIYDMARQSGIDIYGLGHDREKFVSRLKAFAKLASDEEREACAKVCDSWSLKDFLAKDMAKEIRARGQA